MVAITIDNVIELLEQAVNERGEHYIDPQADSGSCTYATYSPSGELVPGCIVGMVLSKAGYEVGMLELWDSEVSGLTPLDTPEEIKAKTSVEVDSKALFALRTAQERQDTGKSWGDAMRAAANALTQEEI